MSPTEADRHNSETDRRTDRQTGKQALFENGIKTKRVQFRKYKVVGRLGKKEGSKCHKLHIFFPKKLCSLERGWRWEVYHRNTCNNPSE